MENDIAIKLSHKHWLIKTLYFDSRYRINCPYSSRVFSKQMTNVVNSFPYDENDITVLGCRVPPLPPFPPFTTPFSKKTS